MVYLLSSVTDKLPSHHRFWGSEIAENPPKVDYRLGADNIMAELTRNIVS